MSLKSLFDRLKLVLIVSLIGLTWLVAFYIAARGFAALPKISGSADLATVMSGAGAIAFAIFSMTLLISWLYAASSIKTKMHDLVMEEVDKKSERIEKELRGRSYAILGYIMGEDSVSSDFSAPLNVERLREAISYCQQSYDHLKNSGLPVEFMALNNFLGYSCVLQDKSRRGYILDEARRLHAAAQEHDSPNLLLTYAKTVLEFSRDPKVHEEACLIIRDVSLDPRLSEKQRREADQLASRFASRCQESGPMPEHPTAHSPT